MIVYYVAAELEFYDDSDIVEFSGIMHPKKDDAINELKKARQNSNNAGVVLFVSEKEV